MQQVSIKTVLAQIALVLDERYWNETAVLEHASRALRQLNLESKWETKATETTLVDHKASLPTDLKYLLQVAYCLGGSTSTSNVVWGPMKLASSPFASSLCIYGCDSNCTNCPHQYSLSPSGVITSTMESGTILISYLAYPVDESGDALIPDDETVKEAIFHYVMYRYWMQKDMMKEEGASSRMQFHLSMWSTLSKKCLSLNLPSLGQMENLKNIRNTLVPDGNQYHSLFTNLGGRQYTSF